MALQSRSKSPRDEVLIEQIQIEEYYDAPDAVGSGGAEQFQIDDTARESESHDPRIEAHADSPEGFAAHVANQE